MTVKQLISKLNKMPQNLKVYMSDHDHSEYETSSPANGVFFVDQSDMTTSDIDRHTSNKNNSDELYSHPKKYVTIRA